MVWLGVPLGIFILALALLSTPYVAGDASHGTGMAGPSGLSNVPYWHPNETKTFELYVKNAGDLTDSYMLNVCVDDPRWSGWLDRYMLPDVPPGERDTFNLSIRAPADAREGDKANITLLARSVRSNKTDHMEWIGFVIVERDVYLKADSSQASVRSGELHEYIVEVVNSGDLDDEYEFRACLTTEREGWTYGINATGLSLLKGQSAKVHVWMRAPPMGVEPATLIVTVQSILDRWLRYSVRLSCLVELSWAASIEPTYQEVRLAQGTEVTATLVLHQMTNDLRPQGWDIRVMGARDDWDVTLPLRRIEANGTGTFPVPLSVTSPWKAKLGDRMDLSVALRHAGGPVMVLGSNLSFTVSVTHSLALSGPQGVVEVGPTGHAALALSIWNEGNVAEVVEVRLGPSLKWEVHSMMDGTEGPAFLLLPWTAGNVMVSFDVPADVQPGLMTVAVEVVPSEGAPLVFNLSVMVGERPAVEVLRDGTDRPLVSPRMGPTAFCATVRNVGNIPLDVRIVCDPPVPWMNVSYEAVAVRLMPGEGRLYRLTLDIGGDGVFGEQLLLLEVWEARAGQMASTDVEVLVAGPDLTVLSVQLEGVAVAGDDLPINVTLANDGRYCSMPTGLVILDRGNVMVGGPISVPSIPRGGTVDVRCVIVPSAGGNAFLLEVNPGGAHSEDGDAQNAYVLRFTAFPARQGDDGAPIDALPIGIAAGVALLVVTLSLAWHLRRRKGTAGWMAVA